MKAPALQRKCSCGGQAKAGGECEACRKKRPALQRKAAGAATPAGPALAPPIVHHVLRQPGRPLDPATRASMEPRFGHDFSRVRIHADVRAAESARAVDARAYTVGRHVVFGEAPSRGLLAHELAHVVQQAGAAGSPRRLEVSRVDGPGEREAERVEQAVARGGRAMLRERTGRELQRRPIEDPIHQPLIEDFRRRHGLPPGGRDEQGRQVGPSDAEIKYGGLLLPPGRRPCPAIQATTERENLIEAMCLRSSTHTREPACAMKALMWPTLPCTTISAPFREMPQRALALPPITSSPPWAVAPAAFRPDAFLPDALRAVPRAFPAEWSLRFTKAFPCSPEWAARQPRRLPRPSPSTRCAAGVTSGGRKLTSNRLSGASGTASGATVTATA